MTNEKNIPKKTAPAASPENVKKSVLAAPDTKSYLDNPKDVKQLLSDQNLFNETHLGKERRTSLGEKIFSIKLWNTCLAAEEVKEAERQLRLGKWGKYKDFSQKDRQDAAKLINIVKKKMKL